MSEPKRLIAVEPCCWCKYVASAQSEAALEAHMKAHKREMHPDLPEWPA